MQQNHILI